MRRQQMAWDILAGEDRVKAAGEKDLPRLDSPMNAEYPQPRSGRRRLVAFHSFGAQPL